MSSIIPAQGSQLANKGLAKESPGSCASSGDLSHWTGKGPEALSSDTNGRECDISSRAPRTSSTENNANINSSRTQTIEAAFTDSEYASVPYPGYSPIVDKAGATGPGFSSSKNETSADDTGAEYSLATTVMQDLARRCMSEVTKDIHSKLGKQVDQNIWESLSKTVPGLIKSFAVKLGLSASNERDRRIMHFVHKRHQ